MVHSYGDGGRMRKLKLHPCGKFNERYNEELTIFGTDFGRLWMWIGLFLLFAIIPSISSHYVLYIINHIGIAAIAAIGLNILIGFTGQISLGHGAFFGVGAYSAAILATALGFPFWLSVFCAGVITALVGMVFGIPSIRLKHLYLTIATLAGQFIIQYLLVTWVSLTKGAEGMGIPIFKYKLLSFAISSFYAGFAGGLAAFYIGSITPEPYTLMLSVEYIAMIIIGGLGSIPGAVFGAIFITVLNEVLSGATQYFMNIGSLSKIALQIAPLREFIFGLAIVLFIIFEPKGLAEVWRIIRSGFRLWPFSY